MKRLILPLITAALLWFVEAGQMPSWALLIVLIREFAVSGLRMIASDKGRVIAAGWSGKVKTASTMVWICATLLLAGLGIGGGIFKIVFHVGTAFVTLVTVLSGFNYLAKNRSILNMQ